MIRSNLAGSQLKISSDWVKLPLGNGITIESLVSIRIHIGTTQPSDLDGVIYTKRSDNKKIILDIDSHLSNFIYIKATNSIKSLITVWS